LSGRRTNGWHAEPYRHRGDIKAASVVPTISRADVADFMLRQLNDLLTCERRQP